MTPLISEENSKEKQRDTNNSMLEILTPASVRHGAQKLTDEELISDSDDESGLTLVDERSHQEDLDDPSVQDSSIGNRESSRLQHGIADLPKNLSIKTNKQNFLGSTFQVDSNNETQTPKPMMEFLKLRHRGYSFGYSIKQQDQYSLTPLLMKRNTVNKQQVNPNRPLFTRERRGSKVSQHDIAALFDQRNSTYQLSRKMSSNVQPDDFGSKIVTKKLSVDGEQISIAGFFIIMFTANIFLQRDYDYCLRICKS